MAGRAGSPRLLDNLSTGIGIVAGLVAVFYLVGLLVRGLRLQQYSLPVESISGQLPQQSLAVVGLSEVGLPLAFMAVIYAVSHLVAHEVRNLQKGDEPRPASTWGPAAWAAL